MAVFVERAHLRYARIGYSVSISRVSIAGICMFCSLYILFLRSSRCKSVVRRSYILVDSDKCSLFLSRPTAVCAMLLDLCTCIYSLVDMSGVHVVL